MAKDCSNSGTPSLLDPRATGGIHAGEGLTVQERYIALQIAAGLQDAQFERFQSERNEDLDVWFAGESTRDHHQVKDENLAKGAVRTLIREFRERNADLIGRGVIRHYVLACPHLSDDVRGFAGKLRIHRQRHFGPEDGGEREASLATLHARAAKLDFDDTDFVFIIQHVVFEEDLVGVARDEGHARSVLASRIAAHLGVMSFAEAEHLANALLSRLHGDRTRPWSVAELQEFLRVEREKFLAGPPRPAGDLILVCHETLMRALARPEQVDLPTLFTDRRVQFVEIDNTAEMVRPDGATIAKVAADLVSPNGPFRAALGRQGPLLYYGFPHVPLAVLAGFIAQPHRHVALVEHDLELGGFRWRPDSPVSGARTSLQAGNSTAHVARLRVSVSARVRGQQCDVVLPADAVRLDLHVEADDLRRGTVASEAQARYYVRETRRVLDEHVAGNHEIRSLHVFAAVPVTVAFLLGQALAHSGLPNCTVYNFNSSDTPPYRWSLDLHAAVAGTPCVHLSKETS